MSPILTNLRKVLAYLYADELSIRRVIDDSGIDSARITFSGSIINIWHSILIEAKKTGQVDNLLSAVEYEYGGNLELQKACQNYRTLTDQRNDQNKEPRFYSTDQNSEQSIIAKNKLSDIDISGIKPKISTYYNIVDKLGPPLCTNDNYGNTILKYPHKGIGFIIAEYLVTSNSIVDSIIIEQPYNYPLLYGLAINMNITEVQKICNTYYQEVNQLRKKNSITYSQKIEGIKYGIELHFLGHQLRRIRYFIFP